jgi:hypothetical protein
LKLSLLVLIALASSALAEPPLRSAGHEFPPQSKPIDGVLVPVPREIFGALDKFANSNWVEVQRREMPKWKAPTDRAQISLLLGALIAEGFMAVEAKDADQVKHIGSAVLKLAAALGVKMSVLRRSSAIIEDAERGDWDAVREEWDGVFADVEEAMRELKSEQLSQLVSVGGWLRGTEALTELILQNYSPTQAELLRQPASLDYFAKRITEMDNPLRSTDLVLKLQRGIRRIRPLMRSDGDAPLSEKAVKEMAAITRELIDEINVKS